jgi:UPF0755 protein
MGTSLETGRNRPRLLRWLLLVLILPLLWLVADGIHFLSSPASTEPQEVVLEVPAGTSLPALATQLERQELVGSAWRFRSLVRLMGAARRIKAGEYQLSTSLRPAELVGVLVRGEVRLHQVTFPEGYTMEQIASLLDSRHLTSAREFLSAASDPAFLRGLGVPASTLEGYLFPDTYRFARGLPAERILRRMLARFEQEFRSVQQQSGRQLGLSRHEVVILASLVEKETAVATERPLIAGVFFNRLRRGIPLQSDPTVIYGLERFDGNLTRAHLQADTPYNTYTRQGLPAGPICNPGAAAVRAVLNPASTPYLYFVAKKDGTHQFSSTLAEHNAAVLRHQKGR